MLGLSYLCRMRLEALVGGAAEVVGPEATLADAADRMVARSVDCLAVVDGRNLVGILTERDVVVAVGEGIDPQDELVSAWMSEAPDTFDPDVSVQEATEWLMQTGYRHLPVMAGGELLGVVSIRDLLWATQTETK
jgi:CBS domain-containing protein